MSSLTGTHLRTKVYRATFTFFILLVNNQYKIVSSLNCFIWFTFPLNNSAIYWQVTLPSKLIYFYYKIVVDKNWNTKWGIDDSPTVQNIIDAWLRGRIESKRTEYPILWPSGSILSVAILSATLMALIRRGCNTNHSFSNFLNLTCSEQPNPGNENNNAAAYMHWKILNYYRASKQLINGTSTSQKQF